MMADWRDVMHARSEADAAASNLGDEWTTDVQRIAAALLALRLELRALGTSLDYAAREYGARTFHG